VKKTKKKSEALFDFGHFLHVHFQKYCFRFVKKVKNEIFMIWDVNGLFLHTHVKNICYHAKNCAKFERSWLVFWSKKWIKMDQNGSKFRYCALLFVLIFMEYVSVMYCNFMTMIKLQISRQKKRAKNEQKRAIHKTT